MSAAVDVRGVTSRQPGPAVLLVEDSEADVLALQRALQPLGLALVCVTSGEEAVQTLAHHDFVAALLDVRLAGAWDGFETARRIREDPRHPAVPLLFITGAAEDSLLAVRAYRAGAVDFLQKPLFPELLAAKVGVFLELWHARDGERRELRAREALAQDRAEEERRRVDSLNATLVTQQEWLQSVLQRLPVPLILVESGTARILFANTKADEHWGAPFPTALTEDDYARAFTLRDMEGRALAATEYPAVRAARGETLTGLQYLADTPRGRRALLVDTAQVPAMGERHACAVVTFQDITSLEEAEQALRKQEQEYRSLAESMPQVVWTAGPDGRTDYINRVFADFIGTSVDVALGTSWSEHIHPEDQPRVSERWRETLRTGDPYDMEYRMRRADGQYRWFLVRALPMRDEQGHVVKWFGTATDVDDARRAAEDNVRLYQASQQAVRLRDEFLSVASHELRTPLTPIRLKVQGLQRQVQAGVAIPVEKISSALEAVSTQTRRLTNLVDGLLDVSRISAGRLELNPEPMDLALLLRDIRAAFEAECTRAGCDLRLHAPAAVVGPWDRLRLEQVVTHLLANALKYGAGRPIHLRVEELHGSALLTVEDHGIGIDPEALPRLFGKFERAVSERHYGGLGLGLYISRQIVAAHGGTIRVESQPGQGARFEVMLPLGPAPT
ncbi:ATP-binding protein [Pyxidicoccus trucidator]|uniref:hybrid sensor histidine kinase/response regulator n=1 Tax=Pyxidicoccus trucidator TaxID=2709662 RepID=UPI0013DA242D|nr:ATP-binding protein [Pyxidicoccus trucidator]